ncbi:HD domain-containing protein [Carboxylicivirga sp. A043]|uniref:Pycsar system effector family protein n=1 Tax=Carboxylicivirga litoralis TaxID=2816963 RepID=UPI0021CB6719|nr:Pycsar system effector family protein [Carboxylicivirga sp. A043]MCU4157345.1 HD domain-containing protein [Carboxylicivirga sp. A043]
MTDQPWTLLVTDCMPIAEEQIKKYQENEHSFHNWEHTLNVLHSVSEIGIGTPEINEKELESIQLAALFHDVKACEEIKGHEKRSAAFAREILEGKQYPEESIRLVERVILSTKLGHQPGDIYEQIIKDADLSHLKNKDYIRIQFLNLFNEINSRVDKTPKQWIEDCIVFFDDHQFYTNYAKVNYQNGKEKNRERLLELSKKEIQTGEELMKQTEKKKKKKKGAIEKPDKGIETMFRVTLRNHLSLSQIADTKANTLISVNGIIISIVLSALFPKLDNNPYLLIPALVLVSFSVATIIISIISTIPRTTHGLMTREDVSNKRGNLIFFGNFHQMEQDDFEWGMDELMCDKDYLYKSLTRDLYHLGRVLNKKYTYLRMGYITFVVGLCISVVAFVISLSLIHS